MQRNNLQIIAVKGKKVTITPEYFSYYKTVSNLDNIKGISIESYVTDNKVGISIFVDGQHVYSREKFRLTKSELSHKKVGTVKPKVVIVNGIRILPLICYELLYPKDYIFNENVDLITHHVYSVMFDLCQYEGWKAIYHILSAHFNCPVLTACGAPSRLGLTKTYSTMSPSGTVLPTDPNEEFLDKKFDPWRKI